MNFHVIVLIVTIVVYIYFRRSYSNTNKKSNLIYILLTPILLYTGRFLYKKNVSTNNFNDTSSVYKTSDSNSDLLSTPFPQSTIDS